jgi:selenocysteine-specific elongation factor
VRGDRYILRRPSPGETLGGGSIMDPNPKGRHKRFDEDVLRSLDSLLQGSPADVFYEAALALNIATHKELTARARLESAVAEAALKELIESGKLINLEDGLIAANPYLMELSNKTAQIVNAHHVQFPLRRGVPKEELKSKLKLAPRVFNAFLLRQLERVSLREIGALIAMPGHEVKFNGQDQTKIQGLMRKFENSPYATPSVKECQSEIGSEVYNALVEMNELVAVSADVVFRKGDHEFIVNKIKETIQANGQITLAETRDLFDTTRKYAQAVLEYLDVSGVTIRSGDARVLKK